MSFYTILLVAVALGTDAFSLAVCMGLGRGRSKQIYLFPLIVAISHVLMPLIGLWLGGFLGKVTGKLAATIGGLLLIVIGFHMFREAWEKDPGDTGLEVRFRANVGAGPQILTGAWALILVAGSVSLDALTAGLGLGAMKAHLALTVITLGVVAGLMTLVGLVFGQKLGSWLGEKAQLLGGIILIIIGITMFF